uniref:Amine oxidase domain-containing protein n=1 Tax=Lactuca sativa TaxID=4236 RepID=A0A9R1V8Q1_LACSA|nr:hypothetical protein LSAT_V11C600319920 [Lactuca sativa]
MLAKRPRLSYKIMLSQSGYPSAVTKQNNINHHYTETNEDLIGSLKMRVAVVAAGISGLVSAHVLTKAGLEVVLYEMDNCLDSASKTFTVNGIQLDLGFMPFNQVAFVPSPKLCTD